MIRVNTLVLKSKIKKLQKYFLKFTAASGAFLLLLSAVFFVPSSNIVNAACDISSIKAEFSVKDNNGRVITQLSNTNTQFTLYVKYTGNSDCGSYTGFDAKFQQRFRMKFSDGSFEFLGPQRSLVFDIGAQYISEASMTWGTANLKDYNTKARIQNNGKLQFDSLLAYSGKEVPTSPITVNINNSQTTSTDQVVAGDDEFPGEVQKAENYGKGLVPCGRDSGVGPSTTNAVRPDDTCTVDDIFGLMIRVTNYLIFLGGFFAMFQIVRSAFSMVLSQGNQESITHAKKHLINAVLGFVLAMMAYLLINTITGILGLKDRTNILQAPIEYIQSGFGESSTTPTQE